MVQYQRKLSLQSHRSAFTLIELLVVIAIVGILSSMLLVGISRARQYSWKTQCLSNLRQIGQGLAIYHDNNDLYPNVTNYPSLGLNDLPSMPEAMEPYLERQIFRCGGDREGIYEREQSSYEWNTFMSGKNEVHILKFYGVIMPGGSTEMGLMWDYEAFHGKPDALGSRNIVYMDGHSEGF